MPLVLAAAVPELFPAIALLLLVFAALIVLRKPLVDLLSRIPAIGGSIAQAVGDGLQGIINWALSWAHQALDPLVQMVWTPVQAVVTWAFGVVSALEALASFVVTLPGEIAGVVAWAAARLASLASSLVSLTARVAAVAASIPAVARSAVASLVDAAERTLSAAIAAARAALSAAIAAVAREAAEAVGALRAWAVAQLLGVTTALSAAVATLGHVTGVELPDIRGQLAHLAEGLGLLTAAGLIGRVVTLERTLTTTIEECITPSCSVIKPQLGTLNALLDIGLLGLVGGIVAEAVANPEGTARATAGIVGGVAGAAEGLASEFAGIHL